MTRYAIAILTLCLGCRAAWGGDTPQLEARERVDIVETNHFFDYEGRLVFTQRIFYRWDNRACRYQVQAWRLVKDSVDPRPNVNELRAQWQAVECIKKEWARMPFMAVYRSPTEPYWDHERGCWVTAWLDGEVFRVVTSQSVRESHTQFDPEIAEREYLPKERRRELIQGNPLEQ